jgi:hypothetical protein
MAQDDVCDCGRLIQQPRTGRRREKCYICSPRDLRDRAERRAPVLTLPVRESDDGRPTLAEATRAALAEVGEDQTWRGVAAICLAELIDAARHGASGAAGNVRAHRESMQYALAQADEGVADVIDLIFRADGEPELSRHPFVRTF